MTKEQSPAQNKSADLVEESDTTIGLAFGAALELPAGRIIHDRYRVIEEIGRGGMGVVYRVEQILLGREMALKTLDGQDVNDTTWRRFQQEAKATSMLNHPNLISVHDSGIIDGKHPYFVMDLVLGTTLAKLIQEKGPLTVEEALPIFIQVCFGLAYAHDLGIVHRDLKPSNIMLAKTPAGGPFVAKIVDFGIAKLHMTDAETQGLTKTGEVFGSPLYMSPEQCMGIAVDRRSDIYSLGCVLFETLTGLPPFMGNTALNTMMKHQSEKPPTLKEATLGKDFPKGVESLVAQLLEKEPDKRYQSLSALARDLGFLQQGISGQTLMAADPEPARPVEAMGKVPIALTAMACALCLLIGGTATWLFKEQQDHKFHSQKLAEEIENYKKKDPVPVPFTPTQETVQSTTAVQDGKKVRRILFLRPIGTFNIVGTSRRSRASGMFTIPFDRNIHLRVNDTECVESPTFFNQFQPGDITQLSMNSNYGVSDMTMKSISHLSGLTYLNLSECDISDESIKPLNELTSLTSLFIGFTQITEDGYLSLKRLNQFNHFSMGGRHSMSRVLKKLKNSKQLYTLIVDRSRLTIEDVKVIAGIKSLTEISVDKNQVINDQTLKIFTSLSNLEILSVAETGVTIASIDTFKLFPKLNTLTIAKDQWSGADVERFRAEYPKIRLVVEFRSSDSWK